MDVSAAALAITLLHPHLLGSFAHGLLSKSTHSSIPSPTHDPCGTTTTMIIKTLAAVAAAAAIIHSSLSPLSFFSLSFFLWAHYLVLKSHTANLMLPCPAHFPCCHSFIHSFIFFILAIRCFSTRTFRRAFRKNRREGKKKEKKTFGAFTGLPCFSSVMPRACQIMVPVPSNLSGIPCYRAPYKVFFLSSFGGRVFSAGAVCGLELL